mmetsp:Transcript_74545/g.132143  ORF Transcript_74545/g.132143 Transcript_74545/m.132143 type:complete len:267 (-) Transcript_74545:6-806(-)
MSKHSSWDEGTPSLVGMSHIQTHHPFPTGFPRTWGKECFKCGKNLSGPDVNCFLDRWGDKIIACEKWCGTLFGTSWKKEVWRSCHFDYVPEEKVMTCMKHIQDRPNPKLKPLPAKTGPPPEGKEKPWEPWRGWPNTRIENPQYLQKAICCHGPPLQQEICVHLGDRKVSIQMLPPLWLSVYLTPEANFRVLAAARGGDLHGCSQPSSTGDSSAAAHHSGRNSQPRRRALGRRAPKRTDADERIGLSGFEQRILRQVDECIRMSAFL